MDSYEFNLKYYYFFISFVIMISPVLIANYTRGRLTVSYGNILSGLSCLFLIFLFGFRDFSVGTDTRNYVASFENMKRYNMLGDALEYAVIGRDPFFNTITYILSRFLSSSFYLLIIAVIYLYTMYKAFYRWDREKLFFNFLVMFSLIFFLSMGINIMRSGLAASFLLLGYSTLVKEKQVKKSILFFVIASLFHYSSLVVVILVFVIKYFKIKDLLFFVVLLLCMFLAFFGFSLKNLPIIGSIIAENERMTLYISGDARQAASGFNIYVITFQFIPILYASYFLYIKKISNEVYRDIFKLFLSLSAFYFLCLNISYSDRFGLLSWIFIPFLATEPLNWTQNKAGNYRNSLSKYLGFVFVLVLLGMYRLFV